MKIVAPIIPGFYKIVAGLAVIAVIAGGILITGATHQGELVVAARSALRGPSGAAQLVSVYSLPETAEEMCPWAPASTQTRLLAAFEQPQAAAASSPTDVRTALDFERPPVRVIRDSYPTYSAVAVDPVHQEIILQDENLFTISVFDRMANTPPTATMTEPKRVIGGPATKVEFNCALYVDPKSGDIYSVNNDTTDTMVVFSRNARGNVPPDRELHTPHRTYGVAVDEAAGELYLTVEFPPQVVVYHKNAAGEEKPIRVMEGPSTRLEDAHGIALDTKNGLMFVANHGNDSDPKVLGGGKLALPSITVYPTKAKGDVAPLRIIQGPKTQLNWPAAMYMDEERGELYVANDADNSILVFRSTDSGDAAPLRIIKGPKTGLSNPTGVYLDTVNREIVVSNMGNHTATVYSMTANGDVAPLRTIRSAPLGKRALAIGNPGAVGYDSKRNEILVPN